MRSFAIISQDIAIGDPEGPRMSGKTHHPIVALSRA